MCRIGGPVITVLGALDSLAAGDPPEKVIVVTAVSLSVGTASAAIALALAPPNWFWAAPLAGASLGFIASEATSGWYDRKYRTALDKLLAVSPGLDPGSRRLPPIGPGS